MGKGPAAALSGTQGCVSFHLRMTARMLTQAYDRAVRPSGLRSTQFTLLCAISVLGPMPFSRLCEMLALDPTTLPRNLRPLMKAGFVRIEAGEDRREKRVALTAAGERKAASAVPLWRKAQDRMTAVLGTDGTRTLLGNLSRLRDAAKEAEA